MNEPPREFSRNEVTSTPTPTIWRRLRALLLVAAVVPATLVGCALPAGPTTSSSGSGDHGSVATAVTINGKTPAAGELSRLEATYAFKLPNGNYWHDPRSGLAGIVGQPAQAFAPGFDFGPVARDASGGNTSIFYNGRELSTAEALFVASLFGISPEYIPMFAGDYILESNGALFKPDGTYLGNLAELAQAKGKAKGGDGGMWCGGTNGANGQTCGNSSGGCSYVSIPSSSPSPSGVPNRIDVSSC